MSSSSLDPTSPEHQRIASLEFEVAHLKAQRDGAIRLAAQTFSLLQAQPPPTRPEGIWIREGDHVQLTEVLEDNGQSGSSDPWRWEQISYKEIVLPTFPLLSTPFLSSQPRPEIVPFSSSFPLEILEAILSLCDTKTIAGFSRSSFACLQLFAPKALRRVSVDTRYNGKSHLFSLFGHRPATSSARLSSALSLNHIRYLSLNAFDLEVIQKRHISTSRLAPGESALLLTQLTIRMDIGPYVSDEQIYDRWGEEDEPELRCFQPELALLSLFNPEKLVVECRGSSFRISPSSSILISNWPRLRFVDLVEGDLFVLSSSGLDDDDEGIRPMDVGAGEYHFFLGVGGEAVLGRAASTEWNVRWVLLASDTLVHGSFEYDDILDQIVDRDRGLGFGRIRSAVVVVKDAEEEEKVATRILKADVEKRGSLKVVVGDA